jgi:hypothetical protein
MLGSGQITRLGCYVTHRSILAPRPIRTHHPLRTEPASTHEIKPAMPRSTGTGRTTRQIIAPRHTRPRRDAPDHRHQLPPSSTPSTQRAVPAIGSAHFIGCVSSRPTSSAKRSSVFGSMRALTCTRPLPCSPRRETLKQNGTEVDDLPTCRACRVGTREGGRSRSRARRSSAAGAARRRGHLRDLYALGLGPLQRRSSDRDREQ